MSASQYRGCTITHEFPGQWEVPIDQVVHLFPSLKTAKAYVDHQKKASYPGPECDSVWANERINELDDSNAHLRAALGRIAEYTLDPWAKTVATEAVANAEEQE